MMELLRDSESPAGSFTSSFSSLPSSAAMNTNIAATVKAVASDAVERLGALMHKSDKDEEDDSRGCHDSFPRRLPPRRWKSADSSLILPNRHRHRQYPSAGEGRRGRRRKQSPPTAVTDNNEFQRIIDDIAIREDDMRRLLDEDPGALNAIQGYFKRGGAITNTAYKEGINICIHQLAAASASTSQQPTVVATPTAA